jgi:hypothetical protein
MSKRRLPFLSYVASFSARAGSFPPLSIAVSSTLPFLFLFLFLAQAKRVVLHQPLYLQKPVLVTQTKQNNKNSSKASAKGTSDTISVCNTLEFSLFTRPS